MKKIYQLKTLVWAIMVTMLATACKTEKVLPQKEAIKDITGSWQVIKATRNGTDLTAIVDFTAFKIDFTKDGYKLVNKMPFLVENDGAFQLDDPQYPYKITFTATGKTPVATAFTYPIVNGKRQLNLTFSPGCTNNSYVYVLEKVN
jgi:hypothetical protein